MKGYICHLQAPEFIASSEGRTILDARSPSEYEVGHIVGAMSLPLFSDDERAQVGTAYKKQSREKAVKLGLELVGPSLRKKVEQAEKLARNRKVSLYCWRGGMRSGSLTWLLRTAGFDVELLEGGYKAYRDHMYQYFAQEWNFITLGGRTGAGKTEILIELDKREEQILDLEGIAKHKGSAFGNIENHPQPSVEHFQNLLYERLGQLDPKLPIWVEDESQHIGQCWINDELFVQVKAAPFALIEREMGERTKHLAEQYGTANTDALKAMFDKIARRLGGDNVTLAHAKLDEGDIEGAAEIALRYYDKSYDFMIEKRKEANMMRIQGSGLDFAAIADQLIKHKNELQGEAHLA